MLEEFTYLSQMVEDSLYIQTGVDIDEFRANCIKHKLFQTEEFKKAERDYNQLTEPMLERIHGCDEDLAQDESESEDQS